MKTLENEHRDSFSASPLFEQNKVLKLASVRGFKKSETSSITAAPLLAGKDQRSVIPG